MDYLDNHPPPCLIVLDVQRPGMDGVHFRIDEEFAGIEQDLFKDNALQRAIIADNEDLTNAK